MYAVPIQSYRYLYMYFINPKSLNLAILGSDIIVYNVVMNFFDIYKMFLFYALAIKSFFFYIWQAVILANSYNECLTSATLEKIFQ